MPGPGASRNSSRRCPDVPSSLGPHTHPFVAWKVEELPVEWQKARKHPDTKCVAVELPDTDFGFSYYQWFCSEIGKEESGLGCVLVSMKDYSGGSKQDEQAARCYGSLLLTGKPSANFVRLFTAKVPGIASTEHQVVFGIGAL